MSVSEAASRLIEMANTYVSQVIGVTNAVASNVDATFGGLAETSQQTSQSLTEAVRLLGTEHPAVGEITASAMMVKNKAQKIREMLQAVDREMDELTDHIVKHSETMGSVGHRIMQKGY
jgi:uncharacterized protein Yka (UPF0111/DUF47 family)